MDDNKPLICKVKHKTKDMSFLLFSHWCCEPWGYQTCISWQKCYNSMAI